MPATATPRRFVWSLFSLAILLVGLAAGTARAQGVAPVSQRADETQPLSAVARLAMPAQDNQALLQQYAGRPVYRFAEPVEVDLTPQNSGTWETLDGGTRLWRLRLSSKEARSLNLGFTRYRMPAGGQLFVYAPGYGEVYGPFTEEDNEDHGELWTPLVEGEEVVVEVAVPAAREAQLDLRLGRVNHAFRAFRGAAKSGSCNVDVVCPVADPWEDQIRAVGAYTLNGFDTCSGALVNNTANDRTPYFLTADHCGVTESNDQTMVVYWNYENSTCRAPGSPASGAPGDGSRDQFNTGTILRADYGGGGGNVALSDMTLVEMDDPIDPSYNVFFAGWDHSDGASTEATAIHHPGVEEKRISFENDPTSITGYLQSSGGDTHIRIGDWDVGTTEGGSSGSPLFNADQRIIGKLSGGYAACGNDDADWYGRLHNDWEGGGTAGSRLKDWLDPGDTGALVLDGINQEDDDVAPAAVTDLSTSDVQGTALTLTWTAPGDDGDTGTASAYDVRYSTTPIDDLADFEAATEAAGEPEPSAAGTAETFAVDDLSFEATYYFALRVRDNVNNFSPLSNTASATTLGAPVASVAPDSLSASFENTGTSTQTLALSNTGVSELTYQADVSTDSGIALSVPNGAAPKPAIPHAQLAKGEKDPRHGRPPAKGEGGPDAFGYEWVDSNEPFGPTYSFVDITDDGTPISLDDDDSETATLSFGFPFYGETKTEVTIGSNGYLTFGSTGDEYTNSGIPDAEAPNDLIAPFWDDLNPSNGGTIHYLDDEPNERFIVQYTDVPHYDDEGAYTFEVILYASGAVVYQYQSMGNGGTLTSNTVGIENADGSDGLEVAANATYVEDNLAVRILPYSVHPGWVTVTPDEGAVPGGDALDLDVTFDAGAVDADVDSTYQATLTLATNDPDASVVEVPLAMVVNAPLPVELTAFEAVREAGDVVLRWNTATEINNSGFEVQYRPGRSESGAFRKLGFVEGAGTTSEAQAYTYRVADLDPGTYAFRLKQIDYDDAHTFSSVETATVTVGGQYQLEAARPNPFRNEAVLRFAVAREQATEVSLYNALGQKVRVLYDGTPEANRMHTLRIEGSGLAAGVYLVHVQGESFAATEKVVLVK